jgi:predicted SnoaL-like aldol condensation-catalyzing enzyme
MSDQNKQVTREILSELFERGNLAAAERLIHPRFVNHEAPPGNPQGREGLKETVTWLRGLWGPMHAEIHDEICEDDKVVARVTMHGRHARVRYEAPTICLRLRSSSRRSPSSSAISYARRSSSA